MEYSPKDKCGNKVSPYETMKCNIKEYEKFMTNASNHKVDIIVFPEYGITGDDISTEDREKAKEFMVEALVGENYCDEQKKHHPILKILS